MSGNPRKTIKEDVWPEFLEIELGERENEVTAEVAGLLATRSDVDPDAAIRKIIWSRALRHRMSITVEDTHSSATGRFKLFNGYDTVADGNPRKRQGETVYLPKMRDWMQSLADKAIHKLQTTVK